MQSGDFYARVISTNYPQAARSHGPHRPSACITTYPHPLLANPSRPSFVSQTDLTCATQPLVATCIQHGTRPCALSDRKESRRRGGKGEKGVKGESRGRESRCSLFLPFSPLLSPVQPFLRRAGSKVTPGVASPWARGWTGRKERRERNPRKEKKVKESTADAGSLPGAC